MDPAPLLVPDDPSLPALARRVAPGATVLDLTPGAGQLAACLVSTRRCTLDGLEPDAAAADRERPHYRKLIQRRLDAAALREEFSSSAYDAVLCTDLLTAAADPGLVLDQVALLLAPGGKLIASAQQPRVLLALLREHGFALRAFEPLHHDSSRFLVEAEPQQAAGPRDELSPRLDALEKKLAGLSAPPPPVTAQAVRKLEALEPPAGRLGNLLRAARRRQFTLTPEPRLHLERQGEGWLSTGTDPHFELQSDARRFPRGWIDLDIQLQSEVATVVPPKLYVDSGNGYNEDGALRLPRPFDGHIRGLITLPARVRGLRFDPLDRSGPFTLGPITMREITSTEAAARLATPTVKRLIAEPQRLGKLLRTLGDALRDGGLPAVKKKLLEKKPTEELQLGYDDWVAAFGTLSEDDKKRIAARVQAMPRRPKISIVMPVYETPARWLEKALESVRAQLYPDWELCIADDASKAPHVRRILDAAAAADPRIKVVYREKNGHISRASNSALELCTGEYVALLDHDDELEPHALYLLAEELVAHPETDLVYSDEDKLDFHGKRFDPHFKPAFSADLLLGLNYISHLAAYRLSLVREVGGFRAGFEGSQDYDLVLRVLARSAPERIRHVPHVLYHWRAIEGSTASAPEAKTYAEEAGVKALQEYVDAKIPGGRAELLKGDKLPARYRVHFPLPREPLVSLLIPTRDGYALLKQCLDSITSKTSYKNYEIVIVDNESKDPLALAYFDELQKTGVARVLPYHKPFNYSAINNFAVEHARGEIVGLLNNDVEVISPEWLGEMVSHALRPEVGAVGAKLWYPNRTLQHAGVIIGLGGVAGHSHKHLDDGEYGYFLRPHLLQNLTAVTAACLLVRKEVFQQVGGLDETNLRVAFNDVDFCLRLVEAGYLNVYTPYAELYHHESVSRGAEDTPEKQRRFVGESDFMKQRWGAQLTEDPYYSPNLTLDFEDFTYAFPPRARRPW